MAQGAQFTQAESVVTTVIEGDDGVDLFTLTLSVTTTIQGRRLALAKNLSIVCVKCGEHVTQGPILKADRLNTISDFAETHHC